MARKKIIILTITVLLFGLLLAGGTYAYWSWRSNTNKNVIFNTADDLKEYIEYDEGDSQFAGSLEASNSYLTGSIHSTITINKKSTAANVDLIATIMMDINQIGTNMRNSSALKWVVTNGNATNPGSLLASGNFIGTNSGDTLTLVPNLEVTTNPKQYTIWIWLDSSEHPSELLSGETLDTNVWTQIDQIEGVKDTFEITRISANNQNISATAVNSKNKITNYAITTTDTIPSTWETIAQADQANVYTLNTAVNQAETYYIWFKDETGKTVSRDITVSTVDTTGPVCIFDTFNPTTISDGERATINLTCTDNESQITSSNLQISDLTKSNNSINITSINKTSVTNGYKYTITVTGTLNDGTPTISLPANKVKNSQNLGNNIVTSGSITVVNNYTITINAGNGVSSVSGTGWTNTGTTQMTKSVQYGTVLNLCEETASENNIVATRKNGYTGCNGTLTTGNGVVSNNTYTVTAGDATLTLSATGIETPIPTIGISSASKIYGLSTTALSASVSNTYDNSITITYTYYYDAVQNGSYTNIQTSPISATSHKGTRYYKVKATASDGTLTSNEATSTNNVSLILIRTAYTPNANNCGTLASSAAKYAYKGENQLYTANTGGNTTSWTTITVKTGYTLDGWYTVINGGSKVLNADGTITNTDVLGYTQSSNFDSAENRTLYARCTANTYTINYTLNGGSASNPTSATYDTAIQIANPTKQGYIFTGWTSTTLGTNAKTGTSTNPATTWDGSLTKNTYFKNLTEGESVTLVANWLKTNYLNVNTNTYYETLNDAFSAVANNQTIRLIATTVDESANTAPTLASTKTGVKLDLYGHTINLGTNVLTNNGRLDIYSSVDGAVLEGQTITEEEIGIIQNNGTLTTSNTSSNTITIRNNAAGTNHLARVIRNGSTVGFASTGYLTLKAGTTLTFSTANTVTGKVRSLVANNKGDLVIDGASLLNIPSANIGRDDGISNNQSAALEIISGEINVSGIGIYNKAQNIEVIITGGTITSDQIAIYNYSYGKIDIRAGTISSRTGVGIRNASSGRIVISGGTITGATNGIQFDQYALLTIGTDDNNVSNTSPIITSTNNPPTGTTGEFYGISMLNDGLIEFYDGKIISHAGTDHAIYGRVSDTPTGYHVKRTTTNGIETAELSNTYTINYTLNGGSASNPASATYGTDVQIANPTKSGYTFTGWTSTTLGTNAKTGTSANPTTTWDGSLTKNTYFKDLTEDESVTLEANWIKQNYLNVDTNTYYETLNDAFSAVANNQTIRLIATTVDESANTAPSLASTKTGVKLDLYGHTINLGNNSLTNNGELDIYSSVDGAILQGLHNVINNTGTLTTSATTSNAIIMQNTGGVSTSDNVITNEGTNATTTLNMGTTLTRTNSNTNSSYLVRLVDVNNGTLNINGATLTTNLSAENARDSGIYISAGTLNMTSGTINVTGTGISSNGTTIITGGNITATKGNGVNNSRGIVTLGIKDSTISQNSPIITSYSTSNAFYGINNYNGTVNFYDGKVVSYSVAINGAVADTPTGYHVKRTTTNGIKTAELSNIYTINYTLNGGSASNPASATYGTDVLIANPTKSNYVFTGWTSTTLGTNAKTGTSANPTTTWDGSLTKNTYFKDLTEDESVTLVANWGAPTYTNIDTGKSYLSLNEAFNDVENDETIRLVASTVDESSNTSPTLANTKTGVKLDLYGHTISLGTNLLTNNGELDIYSSVDGAILQGATATNGYDGVITNNGTLTISDTDDNTILIQNTVPADNYNARVIRNNAGSTATVYSGATITFTTGRSGGNSDRYVISNVGTFELAGGIINNNVNTSTYNRGVTNSTNSTFKISSGEITTSGTIITNATSVTTNITGGTIAVSNNSSRAIHTMNGTGTINISGAAISGAIDIAEATLTMTSGSITTTSGTGISATAGNITIAGGSITTTSGTGISATTGNITVTGGSITTTTGTGISVTAGNITITAGEIIANTRGYSGISITGNGTLTLGNDNGNVSTEVPVISGSNYGVNNVTGTTFNFYDGKIISNNGRNTSIQNAPDNIPNGYIVSKNLSGNTETATLHTANSYSISYNLNGGQASNPTTAIYGDDIQIAAPTKSGYAFTGWTSNDVGIYAKTDTSANPSTTWDGSLTKNTYFKNLTEGSSVTLVANWVEANYENIDTGISYSTLNGAFGDVANNETIRVIKASVDESANTAPTLAAGKTGIKLDLYGNTVSLDTKYLTNNGELEIYSSIAGGIFDSTAWANNNTRGTIINNGTLSTNVTSSNNLTLSNSASASSYYANVIVNNANGTVNLNSGTLLTHGTVCAHTSGRYLINNNGILNVNGAQLISNPTSTNTYNKGINITATGKVTITSATINTSGLAIYTTSTVANSLTISDGTISSTNYSGISNATTATGEITITGGSITGKTNGINLQAGTLTLGNDDSTVSTNSPMIISTATSGTNYGVNNVTGTTFNFYDGKITSNHGNGYSILNTTNNIPTGYVITKNISNNVETATLHPSNSYTISYNLNGGQASNPTTVIYGDDIQIAAPTKSGYAFTGWTSNDVGIYAKTGTSANPTASWDGSLTRNTYFKDLTEGSSVTLVANWIDANYTNIDTGISYLTLNEALADIENDETIRVMASSIDESANTAPTLAAGKSGVKLDLYGHTISLGTNPLTNNGELDIYSSVDGAILEGSVTSNGLLTNNGTLTINDTDDNIITIQNTATSSSNNARAIKNNVSGTLNIYTGATVTLATGGSNGNRYVITNAGTFELAGGIVNNNATTSTYNKGIDNSSDSTFEMTGGEINSRAVAVNNAAGVTISISGGSINTPGTSGESERAIQINTTGTINISGGSINGEISLPNGTLTMTDGIIKSATAAISVTNGTVTITGGTVTGGYAGISETGANGIVTIGDNSNAVSTEAPLITITSTASGAWHAIYNNAGTLNFYDGKVVSNRGHNTKNPPDNVPTGYVYSRNISGSTETATLHTANSYSISYNLDGGQASNPTTAIYGDDIQIAAPTKSGYAFTGWTSNDVGIYAKTDTSADPSTAWDGSLTKNTYFKDLTEGSSVTLVANWAEAKYENIDTNEVYYRLYDALANVENNQTIRVIKASVDESANTVPTLAAGKTGIKLDLYGNTVSLGTKYLTNNGELEIYSSIAGGIFDSTAWLNNNTRGTIINNGTLSTNVTSSNNLTLSNSASASSYYANVIVNNANGTVNLNSGTLLTHGTVCAHTYGRYLIYNNGTLNVNGAQLISNPTSTNTYNKGISITATGKATITSATINTSGLAIYTASTVADALTINNGTINSTRSNSISNATTATGEITITGGSITGKTNGINLQAGTLTLGNDDSTVSTNSPMIISTATSGTNYGINNATGTIFNFYDGVIISNIGAGYAISGTVSDVPTDYEVSKSIINGSEIATLAPYSRMIEASDLINGLSNGASNTPFLNTTILRGEIGTITFAKTIPSGITLVDPQDISMNNNNSVTMYRVNNGKTTVKDYYIIQTGGVVFPANSAYLFYQLPNLTSITQATSDAVKPTNNVIDMSYAFAGDSSLTTLPITSDIIAFDSLINAPGMFMNNTNLESITIGISASPTAANNLENISNMFALNSRLETVSLYMNTSKLANLSNMFDSSTSIENINGIENYNYTNNANLNNMLGSSTSLSNNTQNNVVSMLLNNPNYTGTKTLSHIGLTSAFANQIANNNSNWTQLSGQGWTTGY